MADRKPSATAPPAIAQFFNVMQVRHSSREVFFEFGQVTQPSDDGGFTPAVLVSALVTTPEHAKAMLEALKENVRQYEEANGEIHLDIPRKH